jgi:hypothetical protein
MASVRAITVGDIQSEIEAALAHLPAATLPPELRGLKHLIPPNGTAPKVALCRIGTQREKIRADAGASYWNARTGKAVITFEHDETGEHPYRDAAAARTVQTVEHIAELVKVLDRAERDPRFREFVGLKAFRDQYLTAHGNSWAAEAGKRQEILTEAINQALVQVCRVQNPKDPSFPTTAIRVNRELPEAKRILIAAAAERSAFKPRAIRGEALSSTVLSGRR